VLAHENPVIPVQNHGYHTNELHMASGSSANDARHQKCHTDQPGQQFIALHYRLDDWRQQRL